MTAELRLCVRCDEYRILPYCPRCGGQTAAAPEHPHEEHDSMRAVHLQPGWRLEFTPLTFGRARIIETDGRSVSRFW